jgi:hypothetical protein
MILALTGRRQAIKRDWGSTKLQAAMRLDDYDLAPVESGRSDWEEQ